MKKTVLVVEDDPGIASLLSQQLTSEGFEVTLATDGYEGVNLAQSSKPDLILLDVMMPKMDGFKVCRLIKFNDETKNIPIIMMTSLAEAENRPTSQQVGADAYVSKPFQIDELMAQVRQLTS